MLSQEDLDTLAVACDRLKEVGNDDLAKAVEQVQAVIADELRVAEAMRAYTKQAMEGVIRRSEEMMLRYFPVLTYEDPWNEIRRPRTVYTDIPLPTYSPSIINPPTD